PLDGSWAAHKAGLEARRPFRDYEYAFVEEGRIEHFISTSGAPVFDKDGAFVGYRGIGKDITGRKRVETALVRSERLLRLSQQAASMGTYAIDMHTGRWEGSRRFDEILGIDENFERTVASWRALLHPDDRAQVLEEFQESVAQASAFAREYRI